MWLLVLYDLPVGTKRERYAARKFHEYLLDEGFQMAQFSVYLRFLAGGKEQMEPLLRRIEANAPRQGRINILAFTDKQYGNMVTFRGGRREGKQKNPEQYVLF